VTTYKVIPAKDPELIRLSKAELEAKGTKKAKDELARRKANREAKRQAKLKAANQKGKK